MILMIITSGGRFFSSAYNLSDSIIIFFLRSSLRSLLNEFHYQHFILLKIYNLYHFSFTKIRIKHT